MTHSSLTVAVIDDDDSVRAALQQLLRSASFTVLTYATAEEFLTARGHIDADCLVIDVNLPGMSGVALVHTLSGEDKPLRAVLISARDDPTTLALVKSCRGVPFLRKPFSDEQLLAAISGTESK
jgi:FixJ family two-component response regulator